MNKLKSVIITALALLVATSGVWAQVTVPKTTRGEISSAGLLGNANGIYVDGAGVISASPQVNNGSGAVRSMAVSLMDAAVQTDAQTVATVEYYPGPAMNSSGIQGYLTNLLNGTAAKVSTLKAEDIIATTADLSRGYTYYRVVITNPQGTALRNYILEQDSNDSFNGVAQHSLKLSQDMANFGYDQWRPGYKADGSMITSGDNTQVANRIIIIGVCISFTGVTPAAYSNTEAYIGMQNPAFAITTLIKARGTTGDPTTLVSQSWSTTAVVTPPAHVSLKIQRAVLVTVMGLSPTTSYTVQSAPCVTGPWSNYITVQGAADSTATFTALEDYYLQRFWR